MLFGISQLPSQACTLSSQPVSKCNAIAHDIQTRHFDFSFVANVIINHSGQVSTHHTNVYTMHAAVMCVLVMMDFEVWCNYTTSLTSNGNIYKTSCVRDCFLLFVWKQALSVLMHLHLHGLRARCAKRRAGLRGTSRIAPHRCGRHSMAPRCLPRT